MSESGAPVRCSAGIEFVVEDELIEVLRDDTVMVCGGVSIKSASSKKIVKLSSRSRKQIFGLVPAKIMKYQPLPCMASSLRQAV